MNIALFKVVGEGIEQRPKFYIMGIGPLPYRAMHEAHGVCECIDEKWRVTKDRYELGNDVIINALAGLIEDVLDEIATSF